MTVGRAQGLALIGRPLDISVPILFEANGETVPECADAQVFYGDTRLQDGRISTQIETGGAGAMVRVRASPTINEPVVTVYLNVGCSNRSTRRIVLLAEQPDPRTDVPARAVPLAQANSDVPTSRTERAAPRPPRSSPRAAALGGTATAAGESAPPPQPGASGTTGPAGASDRRARAPQVAPAERPSRRPPVDARQSRLKLEPLDLSAPPGDPTLRMSTQMAAPVDNGGQQRALAGAMWRALNARPEDLMREAQRLEALERDLNSLRASIQRNELALADVRGKLQQAEAERYANPLVYGLAVLALAAALAAAWALRRRGTSPGVSAPWWRPAVHDSHDSGPVSRRGAVSIPRVSAHAALASSPARRSGAVDPDSSDRRSAPPSMPRPANDFSPSMRGGDDFRASNSASLRALRAEELHDVQQEADFFISLGEFDRAIEVLRSHISMNPETSAVAWLDLMEIYHKLDRRHDYDWVRRQFQHNYNAEVPEFDSYSDASQGLEDYENAITRIVALWPSRRVLDVIEESIFRGPNSDGTNAFSLQAYRDLLLLHHVGTEVVAQEEDGRTSSFFGDLGQSSDFGASTFSQTAISPLSALSTVVEVRQPGGPDAGIGLDINLDEPTPDDEVLIGESSGGPADAHLLDFDLPDIDTSGMKPKKTRE